MEVAGSGVRSERGKFDCTVTDRTCSNGGTRYASHTSVLRAPSVGGHCSRKGACDAGEGSGETVEGRSKRKGEKRFGDEHLVG